VKIGPVNRAIIWLKLKKKKLRKVKYLARSASLPSGLNQLRWSSDFSWVFFHLQLWTKFQELLFESFYAIGALQNLSPLRW